STTTSPTRTPAPPGRGSTSAPWPAPSTSSSAATPDWTPARTCSRSTRCCPTNSTRSNSTSATGTSGSSCTSTTGNSGSRRCPGPRAPSPSPCARWSTNWPRAPRPPSRSHPAPPATLTDGRGARPRLPGDGLAAAAALEDGHATGGEGHLQAELDPVDARRVRDPEHAGDQRARQRGDDADEQGSQQADPLPAGQDEPAQPPDDHADDQGADDPANLHERRPPPDPP